MRPSPDFVRTLIHEYDPGKRHEYYERTKKLKGRRKGMASDPFGNRQSRGGVPAAKPKSNQAKENL